jgi:hypothetical protein
VATGFAVSIFSAFFVYARVLTISIDACKGIFALQIVVAARFNTD